LAGVGQVRQRRRVVLGDQVPVRLASQHTPDGQMAAQAASQREDPLVPLKGRDAWARTSWPLGTVGPTLSLDSPRILPMALRTSEYLWSKSSIEADSGPHNPTD
jgi:hypothetical protein